jgi:hypothetical protein
MKKEVLIAIIVGLALGLIITFGIYRAQSSINRQNQPTETETRDETDETAHQLTVIQPENNGIVDEDFIEVTGLTSSNSLVTLVTADSETVVQADELGNFSGSVELTAGINSLVVTSYSLDGSQVSAQLAVVFSTADLGEEDNLSENNEETDE